MKIFITVVGSDSDFPPKVTTLHFKVPLLTLNVPVPVLISKSIDSLPVLCLFHIIYLCRITKRAPIFTRVFDADTKSDIFFSISYSEGAPRQWRH